ncbi:ORF78 [Ictalurid herpesvirus 1]|uniref:Putative zinc-binding protein ORF78 n=1 Tax=Ictalurid herpesvirus 1 (strain Auburn) TaxID=766178 RepID=VG78_ICHVA|nr:ORF78 [Ictalurid herpesvirus 1]Q00167.1 RecName: Full=Putative zinc-binding protein ORF78 [Ictalurid herpesvirus 1 (strain Auburn)]AAA88180.1 ORF78 [Ictalurid herpesvirus 1]
MELSLYRELPRKRRAVAQPRTRQPPPKVHREDTGIVPGLRVESSVRPDSITNFRRLAAVKFKNPEVMECGGKGGCEECKTRPALMLNCDCDTAKVPICLGCKPRAVRDHPCFRNRTCVSCGTIGVVAVVKLGCCGATLCDSCLGADWYPKSRTRGTCGYCGAQTLGVHYRPMKIIKNTRPYIPAETPIPKVQRHISARLLEEIRRCQLSRSEIVSLFGDHGSMMEYPTAVPAHLLAPKMIGYSDISKAFADDTLPRCSRAMCAANGVPGWRCGFQAPVLFPGMDMCLLCVVRAQEQTITQLVLNGTIWEDAPIAGTYHMSVWLDPTTVSVTPVDISAIDTFAVEFCGNLGSHHPEKFYRLSDLTCRIRWTAGGFLDPESLMVPEKERLKNTASAHSNNSH